MATRNFMKRASAVTTTFCSLILVACTTIETQSFRVTGNADIDSAYIATDADFSQYDRLLVDDMGIFFAEGVRMPEEDLARIRQIFRESFTRELTEYEITREPGPGMLKVTASLVDLRGATYVEISNLRRDMRDAARPGALLFLMELRDSGSDRVLARAGDSETAPHFGSAENRDTDWTAMESAAQRWAALFRTFLDQNLGN